MTTPFPALILLIAVSIPAKAVVFPLYKKMADLSVADTGYGIAQIQFRSEFHKFRCLDSALYRQAFEAPLKIARDGEECGVHTTDRYLTSKDSLWILRWSDSAPVVVLGFGKGTLEIRKDEIESISFHESRMSRARKVAMVVLVPIVFVGALCGAAALTTLILFGQLPNSF